MKEQFKSLNKNTTIKTIVYATLLGICLSLYHNSNGIYEWLLFLSITLIVWFGIAATYQEYGKESQRIKDTALNLIKKK